MNWTLRNKILVGYGLVLCLLLLVFAWAFLNLSWLGGASEAILSENYESIRAADNMIGAIERQESGFLLMMLTFEEEGLNQFEQNQPVFHRWLARAENNITIDAEREIIDQIQASYTEYVARFNQVLRDDIPMDQAVQEYMQPIFTDVREACEELRTINLETMQVQSTRTQDIASRALWSVGGLGFLALLLGLVFSVLLSARMTRPVRDLSEATRELASGNYDVRVPGAGPDELGELAQQFNAMAEQLASFQELNVERLITEKRKSEAIIRSITDGIIIVQPDLSIDTLNPAAEQALDASASRLRGRYLDEVLQHETLLEQVRDLFATANGNTEHEKDSYNASPTPASNSEEAGDEQILKTTIQGQERHFQYAIIPIGSKKEERSGQQGALVLLRDVTRFKEIDRLKSEFVATASHELKTPLTSIAMSISMLLDSTKKRLPEEDYELLVGAQKDTDRLRSLIKDLLDLSSIEAGNIDLDFAKVPVSLLFDKTEQILGKQAKDQGIQLVEEVDPSLPDVWGDASKITWVLTNLVSNALRYSSPGDEIRLSAEAIGSKVHISVSDQGEGIPYQYQSKIFDKFIQIGSDETPGGSGLGLAISREIVRALGGSIWVDSALGEGSTFTFTIPVAEG